MIILNDLHLAVQRSAGTTPASREALRSYVFSNLAGIMESTTETDLLVLGDLFDEFEIEPRDWIETYMLFNGWLAKGKTLKLIAGNHDVSSKGTKLSSFSMLARVLTEQSPDQVLVADIGESKMVSDGVMAIAHHANQDLFNQALDAALTSKGSFHTMLLHCNLNNHFAQQADHSLDLSLEMADRFAELGVRILLAHEHNSRKVRNVTVLGNQIVTSVSDCIDSPKKFAHTLNDGVLVPFETWRCGDPQHGFAEINWRDLAELQQDVQSFIKVVGTASSNQAGDCLSAIAKFRAKSQAFVITNGVKIEGVMDNDALPEAFEATKKFDVLEFIDTQLDVDQRAAVKKLLEVQQ